MKDVIFKIVNKSINLFKKTLFWRKGEFNCQPQKILIVTEYLGDTIVSSLLINNLKHNFPESEISLQCRPESCEIAKFIDSVSNVYGINIPIGLKNGVKSDRIFKILKYILANFNKNDVIINVGGAKYTPMLLLMGNYLVEFTWKHGIIPDTLADKKILRKNGENICESQNTLLLQLGLKTYFKKPEIKIPKKYIEMVKHKLNFVEFNKNIVIVVHPISASIYRNWPYAYWNTLISEIIKDFPEVKILIGGSKNDYPAISKYIKCDNKNTFNIAGSLPLLEYFTVIKMSSLLITVDTSAAHAGAAMNKEMIAIYSGNHAGDWDPFTENKILFRDTSCKKYPCHLLDTGLKGPGNCPYGYPSKCMCAIPPETVYPQIKKILNFNK
ncbi:heptosyltransferase-3 [Methanococcus maripaludis]|uniref:Heptosyltransferase-3 n=1 Tax=Methanococcus maripaludis TaxID=39152 RepID=A0A7J9NJC2_METMI|nr:glycosyltransferase family 9 protein [Methanococcus maripaludis]MBA2840767.1 heptosyltransferase-3 [Methanococcus maripaludis]